MRTARTVLAASVLLWVIPIAAVAETPLVDAARAGDAAAVRALIASRADVHQASGDGSTALHWAAHRDDLAMADALIKAGARVNAATDLGATPLYLACTNHSAPMVSRLLEAGADANLALPGGETPLMNCARTGDAAAVRALLARGARVDARESAHQQTALMWAAAERHPAVVAALLAAKADIRARSSVYSQVVTSEVTQRAGRETLNYSVRRGGSTPLLFAARSGDAESARLLLDAGADVNDALADGLPALTLAAYSGHGGVAKVLVDRGADVNAAAIGFTALHAAVLRSDVALVQALLARGASPNAVMTKGTPMRRTSQDFDLPAALIPSTPFLLAARFLEPEILRALKAGGAEAGATMRDGTTALMLAAGVGASATQDRRGVALIDGGRAASEDLVLRTVEALLESGAAPAAVNQAGDTALHAAAAAGLNRVVSRLVVAGAQVNVKNGRGQSPLSLVVKRDDRKATADLLRSLGALD
ncbi:MAG TPA: ankyrin repeat domain-containing protein [Vicinamibacterales bacterium]|nr:ankyrin repeat domain-containing protein [Vicinamibacterales bacterium]